MNTLFENLVGIIESDFAKETLSNLTDIVEYADDPSISIEQAEKIQKAGLKWLDNMENGNEWSLYRHQAMSALSDDAADHKENKLKSVSELKKGDILTNTNHGFDIEIKDIGKKNTRYLNLETGEKIRSFTSKFNFMLRKGVFIKKQSI